MVEIKYLGHSAFEISSNGKALIIDPMTEIMPEGLTDILITHAHSDHIGNAAQFAKKSHSTITAVVELANYMAGFGLKTNGVNLGGWMNFGWFRAMFLPAFHSSSLPNGAYGGCAAGILVEVEGKRIFHAGDTCLNSEMKVLGEVYKPDVALLPVGGHFTMDVEQAKIASKWIGAKINIPMHFNTFSVISVNVEEFNTVEGAKILNIGESLQV